jgi:phage shock protein B
VNEDVLGIMIAPVVVAILFIFLPWLVLHYMTKWKVNSSLTAEDENMLDDLYDLARRLDDRMMTIERIMHEDHPGWNGLASERAALRLEKDEIGELRARRSNAPDQARSGRV